MYRELAAARPDRYRPDLAASLDNLADALMALDRTAAANAARDEVRSSVSSLIGESCLRFKLMASDALNRALTLSVNLLATRVHASDRCHPLGRAGSVKVVFACASTRQFDRRGCPAATDGLDGS